jgi:hypothetical protein
LDFVQFLSTRTGEWIYRGQPEDYDLTTSLERRLNAWGIDLSNARDIEHQIIRECRRTYRGDEQSHINEDTLYCMALMQHHGAPTRLLDWSYSPFVAAKFAIDQGYEKRSPVVWCISASWITTQVRKIQPDIVKRAPDADRNDTTFREFYLRPQNSKLFANAENALHLNERLRIQQGLFLCPGDPGRRLIENIQAMDEWDRGGNVMKLHFKMNPSDFIEFARSLKRMNISSSSLFPGLDGMAHSLGEHVFHYREFAQAATGFPVAASSP